MFLPISKKYFTCIPSWGIVDSENGIVQEYGTSQEISHDTSSVKEHRWSVDATINF